MISGQKNFISEQFEPSEMDVFACYHRRGGGGHERNRGADCYSLLDKNMRPTCYMTYGTLPTTAYKQNGWKKTDRKVDNFIGISTNDRKTHDDNSSLDEEWSELNGVGRVNELKDEPFHSHFRVCRLDRATGNRKIAVVTGATIM